MGRLAVRDGGALVEFPPRQFRVDTRLLSGPMASLAEAAKSVERLQKLLAHSLTMLEAAETAFQKAERWNEESSQALAPRLSLRPQLPARLNGMDRGSLEGVLAMAVRHVAQSERRIARQAELIVEIDGRGWDTAQAKDLLALFRRSLALHIADRDRVLRKLNALSP